MTINCMFSFFFFFFSTWVYKYKLIIHWKVLFEAKNLISNPEINYIQRFSAFHKHMLTQAAFVQNCLLNHNLSLSFSSSLSNLLSSALEIPSGSLSLVKTRFKASWTLFVTGRIRLATATLLKANTLVHKLPSFNTHWKFPAQIRQVIG